MLKEERTFYFFEGIGTLLWVLMDVSWLFNIKSCAIFFAGLAVLGNLVALIYAFLKLDRNLVAIKAVVAYNLWVIMGALWVIGEFIELDKLVFLARIIGVTVILVALWEFLVNRNNTDQLIIFMRSFRKFRIK